MSQGERGDEMLERSARLTQREAGALARMAIGEGDAALMRRLLEAGLDPNGPGGGERWLQQAARRSSSAVFLELLEAGAGATEPDETGETPMMACCRMDFYSSENPYAPGYRPAHLIDRAGLAGEDPVACFTAKINALSLRGASPNEPGERGAAAALDTPRGCRFERPEGIFKALADIGWDLNAQLSSEEGGSVLHAAAEAGAQERLEALLRMGADPTLKDDKGLTALDRARRNPWPRITRALEVAQERWEIGQSAGPGAKAGARCRSKKGP